MAKLRARYSLPIDPRLRKVTAIPVPELFDANGRVDAQRGPYVTRDEVRRLLRAGPVQFVVATIGGVPRWVPLAERFDFWKSELEPRIVETPEPFVLDEYPGEYCYLVSRWATRSADPLLLAEMYD